MEIIKFFKSLNKKINEIDKLTKEINPFIGHSSITLVWVEEECPKKERFDNLN